MPETYGAPLISQLKGKVEHLKTLNSSVKELTTLGASIGTATAAVAVTLPL